MPWRVAAKASKPDFTSVSCQRHPRVPFLFVYPAPPARSRTQVPDIHSQNHSYFRASSVRNSHFWHINRRTHAEPSAAMARVVCGCSTPCWLRLRRGGCGVRRGTRYALARCARTTTASQLTKRVCPAAHPPPRALRAPGASRRGGAAQQPKHPHGPSLRSALHAQRRALAPAHRGPSAAKARMDV